MRSPPIPRAFRARTDPYSRRREDVRHAGAGPAKSPAKSGRRPWEEPGEDPRTGVRKAAKIRGRAGAMRRRSTGAEGENSAGPPGARLGLRGDRPPRPPSCFPRAPHSGDDGTATGPAPSIAPRERLWTTLGITLGQSRQVCGSVRHFMWITRWTEPVAALSPGEMRNFRSSPYVGVRPAGTFPKTSARGRGQIASEPLRWVACQPT